MVKEEERSMVEKEAQILVHLAILKQDMSSYSSLIMLIARKISSMKRIIIDFRFFNSRLQRVHLAFSFLRDAFTILENFKCECLSVLDLKEAYHTIKLSENYKPYCVILPCFGSTSYVYQRMSMGLTSPAIRQPYINAILSCISDGSKYLAIVDYLLLHSSKHSHLNILTIY